MYLLMKNILNGSSDNKDDIDSEPKIFDDIIIDDIIKVILFTT